MIIDPKHLYKQETGMTPHDEKEYILSCFRSKGQWVVDISDVERLEMFGRQHECWINLGADPDYVEWLENKVMELLKK
jgi:hypothetical protein